jgi:hypothetical protein
MMMMMMRDVTPTGLALAIGGLSIGLVAASPARADPQVLGVVASLEPQPLVCDDSGCRVELTAFCLEQLRKNPLPGQAYRPAEDADIALLGIRADGSRVTLPAAPYLHFTTERGFTAIEARLDKATLDALGLTGAAVVVGQQVSLLPEPAVGDPEPQSPEEIAIATGPSRKTAVQYFDQPGEETDALRVANAMINSLPQGYRRADSDGSLWAAPQVASISAKVDPAGLAEAAKMHADCQIKVDVTHHVDSMRACLEGSHDRLVVKQNIELWNALGGS